MKSALARGIAAGGGLRRRHAGKLVILTFHRVRPDGEAAPSRPMRNLEVEAADFRRILAWMSARYEPVALGDWLARPAPSSGPAFAVTLDDGWADNVEFAFPVLRELSVPATIFLATGAVEERAGFWWQAAGLTDAAIEQIKAGDPARIDALTASRGQAAADFLTWEQIHEMGSSGLVTFGPHGHRHALLDHLSREEARADIRRCWELLQERIPGAVAPVLAWPNGNARADLDADLEALGLMAAVGTGRGAVSVNDARRWNLPRNNVDRRLSHHPGLLPWLLLRAG